MAIRSVGKRYMLYDRPHDRLKEQILWRFGWQFGREFWALRDVTLEVGRGEAVGIVGRNGSGKSTLLHIIAGTLAPTTGTVDVHGRVAALLELGAGFDPELTGRENVYLNAALLGFRRAEVDARFDDIAAFADIGRFLDHPVKTYSTGMFVRLAFAVAVSIEPDVLLIDEALAVGDLRFQIKCLERLHRGLEFERGRGRSPRMAAAAEQRRQRVAAELQQAAAPAGQHPEQGTEQITHRAGHQLGPLGPQQTQTGRERREPAQIGH